MIKDRYSFKKTIVQTCTAWSALTVGVQGFRTEEYYFGGIEHGFFLLKFHATFRFQDEGNAFFSWPSVNMDILTYSDIDSPNTEQLGDWQALTQSLPAPSRNILRLDTNVVHDFTENGVYIPGRVIRVRQFASVSNYTPTTNIEYCHGFYMTLGFQGDPRELITKQKDG